MHAINIHIDESINHNEMGELYRELMTTQFVRNVELHEGRPHDILVEFEEHHDMPVHVLDVLHNHGLHADIVGC